MAKVICVFGATGLQGSSVVRSLVQDPKYAVRAVTRNPDSDKAKALSALGGVEVVKADLNDRASLNSALDGAYGCFLNTDTDFPAADRVEREFAQGKYVADIAAAKKIQHIVLSSLPNVKKATGKTAANCDAKALIDEYMRKNQLPVTSVVFPFYYQNFTRALKPRKLQENTYGIGIPMGETPLAMYDIDRAGDVVRYVLDNPGTTMRKTFRIVADRIKISEVAEKMTKIFPPNVFRDLKVTVSDFRQLPFPGADDLANMFEYHQKSPDRYDIEETKRIVPTVTSFEQWLIDNKDQLYSALK